MTVVLTTLSRRCVTCTKKSRQINTKGICYGKAPNSHETLRNLKFYWPWKTHLLLFLGIAACLGHSSVVPLANRTTRSESFVASDIKEVDIKNFIFSKKLYINLWPQRDFCLLTD